MEKEQKKLLLVAISVGVFLLITVTVATVLLTPKVSIQEAAFSSSQPLPAQQYQPAAEITPEITLPEPVPETTDGVRETVAISGASDRTNTDQITINIPRPTTAAVPDVQEPPVARQTVTPARTAAAATAPAQPAARAAAQQTPARQTAPARTINDYWVQTGAFSAMVRAEDAKETLASKGITSIIENRVVDGRVWYRVRLGPYTSEKEASYWLALVKEIGGFEESQIRQTVRQN